MYTNLTTMKKSPNHLNNDYEKLSGRRLLKNARIPMKHMNIFFETFSKK